MHDVADKYDCKKYVKLEHSIQGATWNDAKAKWDLEVKDGKGRVFSDEVDIFINASGVLK